jgi:two-component system chemotaxis response regulator CheB
MRKWRVVVIDDSALMRQLLSEVLASDRDLEVVGTASNPVQALDVIARVNPDVLTLDVHMPRMDGLTFLEKLMQVQAMPVVMVSSATSNGCQTTLRALELGAVDYVLKPSLDVERGIQTLAAELIGKVKAAAGARVRNRHTNAAGSPAAEPAPATTRTAGLRPRAAATASGPFHRIVALGASTGGTEALRDVLTAMPPEAPAIVIVQHMPEQFTRSFAERLDGLCRIPVKEAEDNDAVRPGHALLAPGNKHMRLVKSAGGELRVRLGSDEPVCRHRPSVDVLFRSCAEIAGAKTVGAILTGMGADGAAGLLAMRLAGGITLAQDEASCVVFGMPREAIAKGAVCRVLPLDRIGQALLMAARS